MTKYSTIIGMDLGDKHNHYCELDGVSGEIVSEGKVPCNETALTRFFEAKPPCLVAIETGTHSPWISRLLTDLGHELLVANARKLRAIYENKHKSDPVDAQMLARIARMDPKLLSPIRHRGQQAQEHRATLRSRDAAVAARTKLTNHVRGVVKSNGHRLPSISSAYFHAKAAEGIPKALLPALAPMLKIIGALTATIKQYDKNIALLSKEHYPETELLRSVPGVGPITALCFVLTIEDPHRFAKSRNVPAYFGLTPARSQSGDADPELRITKEGDSAMRRLLVSCAQYILGNFGPDSELRQWGLRIAERGVPETGKGKRVKRSRAKRRAVVAVARKLAVILHRLWVDGMCYEPFPNTQPKLDKKTDEHKAAA